MRRCCCGGNDCKEFLVASSESNHLFNMGSRSTAITPFWRAITFAGSDVQPIEFAKISGPNPNKIHSYTPVMAGKYASGSLSALIGVNLVEHAFVDVTSQSFQGQITTLPDGHQPDAYGIFFGQLIRVIYEPAGGIVRYEQCDRYGRPVAGVAGTLGSGVSLPCRFLLRAEKLSDSSTRVDVFYNDGTNLPTFYGVNPKGPFFFTDQVLSGCNSESFSIDITKGIRLGIVCENGGAWGGANWDPNALERPFILECSSEVAAADSLSVYPPDIDLYSVPSGLIATCGVCPQAANEYGAGLVGFFVPQPTPDSMTYRLAYDGACVWKDVSNPSQTVTLDVTAGTLTISGLSDPELLGVFDWQSDVAAMVGAFNCLGMTRFTIPRIIFDDPDTGSPSGRNSCGLFPRKLVDWPVVVSAFPE